MTPPKKRRKRVDPSKRGSGQVATSIYFYPDEHAIVKAAAELQGISVSAFATKAALEAASRLPKK